MCNAKKLFDEMIAYHAESLFWLGDPEWLKVNFKLSVPDFQENEITYTIFLTDAKKAKPFQYWMIKDLFEVSNDFRFKLTQGWAYLEEKNPKQVIVKITPKNHRLVNCPTFDDRPTLIPVEVKHEEPTQG